MNIDLGILSEARVLGIREARAGVSNTATVSHILREIHAPFGLMDITPAQVKLIVSYYDKGVTIGKAY